MSWDDEDSTCSQGEISSIISFSPIYHKETALVLGNTQILVSIRCRVNTRPVLQIPMFLTSKASACNILSFLENCLFGSFSVKCAIGYK